MLVSDFRFEEIDLNNAFCISPFDFADNRGELVKVFSAELYKEKGIDISISEVLIINSKKNVLRGIHFQKNKPVEKLITCLSGCLYAVVLDIDKTRESCGKWKAITLQQGEQLFVPKGCALGTYAVEDSSMLCINGEKMIPGYDTGIRWNDSTISVRWPCYDLGIQPIVSEKDKSLLSFSDYLNDKTN